MTNQELPNPEQAANYRTLGEMMQAVIDGTMHAWFVVDVTDEDGVAPCGIQFDEPEPGVEPEGDYEEDGMMYLFIDAERAQDMLDDMDEEERAELCFQGVDLEAPLE
ncbi:MAG TPA: hypothetical protein VFL85_00590 [Candidatus Saccharimonadales bacterium]|nr:hypothetical protein [Candidatus Saccharimonadales bacterium]